MKKVKDFFNSNPITVRESESIESVFRIVHDNHLSHLLVTNDQGLSGVISKEDLLRRMALLLMETTGPTCSKFELSTKTARDYMTPRPTCVKPEDDIDYAIELLLQQKFHCLPVLDEARNILGIMTSFDIVKGLYSSTIPKKIN